METWEEVAAHYAARLEKVLAIRRRALDLASLPQAGVDAAAIRRLEELGGPLERQYERLRKNEFRIAVVGLEKAGKSTFVNAWLGCDLLPNESHRCTFTTTQVFSVGDGQEQRLEVTPKSRVQFDDMVRDLKRQADAGGEVAAKARNDLEAIERHRTSIDEVLRQGEVRQVFTRLEDVAQTLRRYVADERYVYGVLEARLFTAALAAVDGVAFYDVPGLNSGLTIHEAQAERMLADCDAVILVQRVGTPSIEGSEQKLIRFVQEGDGRVAVADKLFVFLGRADQEGTREMLADNRGKAIREWQRRGQLPEDRIVVGSAAAYLVIRGMAGDHLAKALDRDEVRRNVVRLTGADSDAAVLTATGIPQIKQRVERYLRTERVSVLHKRCEAPIRETVEAAQTIYDHVRLSFAEDPAEAQRQLDADRRIQFQQWWEGEWELIAARLSNYFQERARKQAEAKADPFRVRYSQLVTDLITSLPSRAVVARDRLFDSHANPVFSPSEANPAWRFRLYHEVMTLIDRASGELAAELKSDAVELVDFLRDGLLYGSADVGRLLVGSDRDFLALLQGKLQTLFLRFARPVVEALVRLPVADPARKELLTRLGADVNLLDAYFDGDEPAFRELRAYAKYGRDLLIHAPLRDKLLGAATTRADRIDRPDPSHLPRRAETREEVTAEVESDLGALEIYLTCAVFAAAGFGAFREQELERLRSRFLAAKAAWAGVAQNEDLAGNARIRDRLPPHLRATETDTEVCHRLRQLRTSLEAAR